MGGNITFTLIQLFMIPEPLSILTIAPGRINEDSMCIDTYFYPRLSYDVNPQSPVVTQLTLSYAGRCYLHTQTIIIRVYSNILTREYRGA